eukprot:scaffold22015_cov78-Phaeocystis_antarctica.AAC.5
MLYLLTLGACVFAPEDRSNLHRPAVSNVAVVRVDILLNSSVKTAVRLIAQDVPLDVANGASNSFRRPQPRVHSPLYCGQLLVAQARVASGMQVLDP